jgi:hypothetical protein
VGGGLTADRARQNQRDGDGGGYQREPHRGCTGREWDQRRDDRAGPRADDEPEATPPADLHDRNERHGQEQQQGEARAGTRDEQGDEGDQAAAPEVEQEATPSRCQPRTPGNHHRDRVAGRRRQRCPDQEPAMLGTHIERETDKHDDDRSPAEPEANLQGSEAEAELQAGILALHALLAERPAQANTVPGRIHPEARPGRGGYVIGGHARHKEPPCSTTEPTFLVPAPALDPPTPRVRRVVFARSSRSPRRSC